MSKLPPISEDTTVEQEMQFGGVTLWVYPEKRRAGALMMKLVVRNVGNLDTTAKSRWKLFVKASTL